MATYGKQLLSGSTDGKQIKVVATATAGTLLHTAHATDLDEIWLWAFNSSVSPVVLTLEWGEATVPDGNNVQTIQPQSGYVAIVKGNLLTNSLVVRAFAGVANVVMINGFVNRITP